MDLELTQDQRELGQTVARLMRERYGLEQRNAILASDEGYSEEMWQQYAELGLLGLPFSEEHGGADMGFAEVAVVLQEFGKALALEPYIPTVVIAGTLIKDLGSDAQQKELLSAIAEGSSKMAFAAHERGKRWSLKDPETKADQADDGYTISGEKTGVVAGPIADTYIVSAKTDDGVGLFLVKADADGVTRDDYKQADGLRASNILFKNAKAERLGEGDASNSIAKAVDIATAALCQEAAGAMGASLDMTVEYLKQRVQFDRPLIQNQALQHRLADLLVSLEDARNLALFASLTAQEEDYSEESHRNITAAKIGVNNSARHISQESIQMHGGIGMTMEYPIGHFAKRLTVIPRTFSDTDTLMQELTASGGLIKANNTLD